MNCKLRRLDMLRSGQLSDCEVRVWYSDRNKRCHRVFCCHQFLLVSASEEFGRLCRSPNFERNHRVIDLDDASPQAYEALILYIYTYEVCNAINLEMCGELMLLAIKHKMYDFIDCYLTKLSAQDWPMEVVLQIFHLANQHNSPVIMDLVAKKILPIATKMLKENVFLRLNVRELKALMIIMKAEEIVPDKELLCALKKYQVANNLSYCDMERFQQFVEVARLFEEVYFAVDGSLTIRASGDDEDDECVTDFPKPEEAISSTSKRKCFGFVEEQESLCMENSWKPSSHSNVSRIVTNQDLKLDVFAAKQKVSGFVETQKNPSGCVVKQENVCGCVVKQEKVCKPCSPIQNQSNNSKGPRVVEKKVPSKACGCGCPADVKKPSVNDCQYRA
ncbi:uncharacterized protein [Drosophila pseudoobscura]|uniref:BTB domain-containing protein n=1 Tax=Drosophila pseudoobscura pseudoobscura TaxID=46245 RepID=A0A6I8UNI1_DROPS|nr:uncharacterized protein LOC4801242 [Drosophila pseudoobscura]